MKRVTGFALGIVFSASVAATTEPGPLVDVAWIKENSCAQGVRVLDIRSSISGDREADYQSAHIPCAVYTDYMKGGWRTKVKDVVGQLPPVDNLEKLIGSLGIDNDTHVVIYHAGTSALDLGSATRVYWTFKVLGHDKVSILNGGIAAYVAAEAPTSRVAQKPESKQFKAALRQDMLIGKEDVAKALNGATALVDYRPSDNYQGINRHPAAKRNGTLPGARNVPEAWLTENNGGKLRDRETLAKLFKLAEVPTDGEQIAFCNTGHWASLGWFVSSEIMGNRQTKMYDGSMVEWSADAALPMETKVILQ